MTQTLHVCTICCRPEVVYDVISGRNVKAINACVVVNFEIASSSSFRDIKKQIISWRRRRLRPSTIALSENAFAFRLKTAWILQRYLSLPRSAPCLMWRFFFRSAADWNWAVMPPWNILQGLEKNSHVPLQTAALKVSHHWWCLWRGLCTSLAALLVFRSPILVVCGVRAITRRRSANLRLRSPRRHRPRGRHLRVGPQQTDLRHRRRNVLETGRWEISRDDPDRDSWIPSRYEYVVRRATSCRLGFHLHWRLVVVFCG